MDGALVASGTGAGLVDLSGDLTLEALAPPTARGPKYTSCNVTFHWLVAAVRGNTVVVSWLPAIGRARFFSTCANS